MSETRVSPGGPLRGRTRVPGDKSISHRAVMLASAARGETRIEGLLRSDDVMATAGAFRSMGVEMDIPESGAPVVVKGRGFEGLAAPEGPIYLGNSGTSMRLLAGLLAGRPINLTLTGDKSLNRRPMMRVVEPLRAMGANIETGRDGSAPLKIKGGGLTGILYKLPVASAQVKSALLLAGVSAEGETVTVEPEVTRDHTERLLPLFGVPVEKDGLVSTVRGGAELVSPGELFVPGDVSSAAFLLVAALLTPGSELTVEDVGVNPTRTGVLDALEMMGADITVSEKEGPGGEPVADVTARYSELTAVEIGGELTVRSIDELPVLCVAAARARGRTVIGDAAELRVKESDRIAAMVRVLGSMGADVVEYADGLAITGPAELTGGVVDCGLDHRVGMSAAVAALCCVGETVIRGSETIQTSFPGFFDCLTDAAR